MGLDAIFNGFFKFFDARENLTPGTCQCGHARSFHCNGVGACFFSRCTCDIYIEQEKPILVNTAEPTGETLEAKVQRYETLLHDTKWRLNRCLDDASREKIKLGQEITGRLTSQSKMIEDALLTLEQSIAKGPVRAVGYKEDPADMSAEDLCQRFASLYQIHSNPMIYNYLKSGHDELLKRLSDIEDKEQQADLDAQNLEDALLDAQSNVRKDN